MAQMYRVFKRRAWKKNPDWPDGLEPDGAARKTTVTHTDSIDEARRICKAHNDQRQGKNDLFCEFESE